MCRYTTSLTCLIRSKLVTVVPTLPAVMERRRNVDLSESIVNLVRNKAKSESNRALNENAGLADIPPEPAVVFSPTGVSGTMEQSQSKSSKARIWSAFSVHYQ